jgi:AraC family transcriptional regulator, transcriptional activator of pobA
MVEIFNLEQYTDLRKPRRIMKYAIIYCISGEIKITVDEKELILCSGMLVTITSGQYHYLTEISLAKGLVLEFTLDFFCKDDKDIELIFQNGLFCHFDMNEVIAVNKEEIEGNLYIIQNELAEKPYQYLISIHSRIKLILVAINRAKIERGDEIWKPEALFLRFLEEVRHNFQYNLTLTQFADRLSTTELRLNELSKIHAGKTAQKVIYGLITSEAKRLLIYENITIKEVAFRLGFNDPFYFSNFFKKQTNQSPKLYQATKIL